MAGRGAEDYIKVKSSDEEDLSDGFSRLTLDSYVAKRQFTCIPCDKSWWKDVFKYKPVSRCASCQISYKAIPREKEFGQAGFFCLRCYRYFTGWGQRDVSAPCYKCGEVVFPSEFGIKEEFQERRSTNKHACAQCENGGILPCPIYGKILVASEVHHQT